MIKNEEILVQINNILNAFESKIERDKIIPNKSGIYFFIAKKIIQRNPIEIKENEIAYIGKAESLSKRIEKRHLRNNAKSTLRKTLGAIFSLSGERLTNWIKNNFYISFCEVEENLLDLSESLAVYKYNPPLNIDKKPKSDLLVKYLLNCRKNDSKAILPTSNEINLNT
jgi:excinuclease UvrABC nuclease subunit